MSGNGYVIDNWGLLVALLMVAVAALVSELMRISIGKTLMWSAIRALVQLCVMGVIIGYVIRSNNPWLVFGVIAVMLVAAVQITLSRAKGIPKGLAGPVLLSLVITMLLMISLVTELVVRPHPWYAPQLVVPLTGMLLGNTVSALAVGLSRFYESMNERRDEVDTLLALGATPWEAARPSIVSSIRLGLLPTTASLASCGIVTIPGMMAGQVIAGGDPLNAAKYQFVVLAAIAALTLVADALIMTMTYRTCFTDKDQYKPPEDRCDDGYAKARLALPLSRRNPSGSAAIAFYEDVGDGQVRVVDQIEQDHSGQFARIHEGVLLLLRHVVAAVAVERGVDAARIHAHDLHARALEPLEASVHVGRLVGGRSLERRLPGVVDQQVDVAGGRDVGDQPFGQLVSQSQCTTSDDSDVAAVRVRHIMLRSPMQCMVRVSDFQTSAAPATRLVPRRSPSAGELRGGCRAPPRERRDVLLAVPLRRGTDRS